MVTSQDKSTVESPDSKAGSSWREILPAVGISLVVLLLVNLFIKRYDLEGGRSYGVQGVPPSVSWFLLFLLLIGARLAARIAPRLALTRRQLLLAFGILALAIPISAFMGVRSLMPHLTLLPYYAGPDNEFTRIAEHIPDWLMPKDQQVLIPAFEGSEDGRVMWRPWAGPIGLWGSFMLVLGLTTLCWVTMLRGYWNRAERLSYPMLELPRQMTGIHRQRGGGLLSDPLMWIGFGLAVLFQAGNLGRHFIPTLPAIPSRTDLAPFLTEVPLSYLLPLRFYVDPTSIGAAYLVPGDILFSVWSIYLLYKVVGLVGGMFGLVVGGEFPYYQEQSTGGYIAYGLLLLYFGRHHLAKIVHKAVDGKAEGETYPLSPSLAFYGVVGGGIFIVAWCVINQFALKLAIPYFIILLLYTLVQARLRAETGVPLGWAYPFGTQKTIFDRFLGTQGIVAAGGEQGLVMLSYYSWLARYNYLGETAAFQTDAATLWEDIGVRSRQALWAIGIALVAGIGLGFWVHLQAYYNLGASMLQGGSLYGTANNMVARAEYLGLSAQLISPAPADTTRIKYIVFGFFLTPLIALVRSRMLRFPFHPLGFLLATCYGPTPYYWSSFMLAWVVKSIILRLGGAGAYRRAIPFFLGLVLGNTMSYDVIWMVIRALLPEGMVTDYI